MDPIFLPDVEERREARRLARRDPRHAAQRRQPDTRRSGTSSPICPTATQHLARFTQEILRGPAPLSPGLRELIAALHIGRNDCAF